jgi:protein-S-isoprenylcysteine O-methyltransferase Ste14
MLKATAVEFRLRFLICIAIYVLGFTAPWNHLLHLDAGRTAWLSLAAWPAHNQWLTFTATTVTLLAISILCALAAALLRTWASACLGPTVVQAHTMQGDTVVASGPFRYLRNPLYFGTFIHTFALALLMPPTGAIFCILAIGLFQLRLIAAEEAFLTAKLGDPYLAYCARVPRLFPAFTPHVSASPMPAKWPAAFLAEIYMWGVVASFAILGWRYNAFLIIQGIIVSLGLSLVALSFTPKR